MRRTLVLGLAALALLGVVPPDAFAQAPAAAPTPPFNITGSIDEIMSNVNNVSTRDRDQHRRDTQWVGRTRGRFDFIGEYGKNRAVLGMELDATYGQTGSNDSNIVAAGAAATTAVATQ